MEKKKRHSGKHQKIPECLLPERKKERREKRKRKRTKLPANTPDLGQAAQGLLFLGRGMTFLQLGVCLQSRVQRLKPGCEPAAYLHSHTMAGAGGGGTDLLGNRLLPPPPALHGSAEGPAGTAAADAAGASFVLRHTGPPRKRKNRRKQAVFTAAEREQRGRLSPILSSDPSVATTAQPSAAEP